MFKASRFFCLFFVFFLTLGCQKSSQDKDYRALVDLDIQCPEGSVLEFRPWGGSPNGLMAICQIAHGPYATAKEGKIFSVGENNMGKKVTSDVYD